MAIETISSPKNTNSVNSEPKTTTLQRQVLESHFQSQENPEKKKQIKQVLRAMHTLTTSMGSNGIEQSSLTKNPGKWAGNVLNSVFGARWVSSYADRALNLNDLPDMDQKSPLAMGVKNLSNGLRSALSLDTGDYFADFSEEVTNGFVINGKDKLKDNILQKVLTDLGPSSKKKKFAGFEFRTKLVKGKEAKLLNALMQFGGFRNTDEILDLINDYNTKGNSAKLEKLMEGLATQIQKVTKLSEMSEMAGSELGNSLLENVAGSISSTGIHVSDSRSSGLLTWVNMLTRGVPGLNVLKIGSSLGFAVEGTINSKQDTSKVFNNLVEIERPKIIASLQKQILDFDNLPNDSKEFLISKKMMPVIAQYASQQAAQDRNLIKKKETLVGQTKQFFLKSMGLKKGFGQITDAFKGEVNGISNLQGLLAFTHSYHDKISQLGDSMGSEQLEQLLELDKELKYQPDLENLTTSINEQIGRLGTRDIPTLLTQLGTQAISSQVSGSVLRVIGAAGQNFSGGSIDLETGNKSFNTVQSLSGEAANSVASNFRMLSNFGSHVQGFFGESVNYIQGFFGESVNAEPINPPSTEPYEGKGKVGSAETKLPNQSQPVQLIQQNEPSNSLKSTISEPAPAEAVVNTSESTPIKLSSASEIKFAFVNGDLKKGSVVVFPDGKTYTLVGDHNGEVSNASVESLTNTVNKINQEQFNLVTKTLEIPTQNNNTELPAEGKVVKLNSRSQVEEAVIYSGIQPGQTVEVNGYKVLVKGDAHGAVSINTIKELQSFFDKPTKTPEKINPITATLDAIIEKTGANELVEKTTQTIETIIPLTSDGKISLMKLELPTSFGDQLTLRDVGDVEQIPANAKIISDNVDGAVFYEFQNNEGKTVIRVALEGDVRGTGREIMNPGITFELTTEDGVKIDPAISNKILHEGLDEREVYNAAAEADPENRNIYIAKEGNDLDMANTYQLAPGVNLRDLLTNAGKFTSGYNSQFREGYTPGTVAFLNMFLAADNETRDELLDRVHADRIHIRNNPGEQAGFGIEPDEITYRKTLRQLESLGFFKKGFNGQDLNEVAREVQLDSGTSFMENRLNQQRILLLESASEIYKQRNNTNLQNNQNVFRAQQKFFNGSFMNRVAQANTPNQLRDLTEELSNANFDFSGADNLAYNKMMVRVEAQRVEFEKMVPYMNAYIQATGGEETIQLTSEGLVQGVKLEKFNSSIGLNLPDISTPGGAIQALSMAWGITKGQIPIPLKFEQSGSIGFGDFSDEQMAALTDKNNPRYEIVRTGISPQAQSILAPIFKAAGIPFILTGTKTTTSGYAGEIQVEIPAQLLGQVEATENGIFLLEDLINNHPDILAKLNSSEGLGISDIQGIVKDRDGNILEGEQLKNYLKAMNTYYVAFEKTREHARAGDVGVIESLEVAMKDPVVTAGIRKELGSNEYEALIIQNSKDLVESLESERDRINQLVTGENARVDGSAFLQAAGVDRATADKITLALQKGDRNTLSKYNITEETIKNKTAGTYYTNPGGLTPDGGHKLGMNHVIYEPGFKMVTLEIDGKKFRFDPVCGNYVRFWDTPSPSKPDVCLTGEVCIGKIYDANTLDADTASAKQTVERSPEIAGSIDQMAEHNIALTIANEEAQKGTIPYLRDMVLNAPDGESLQDYITIHELDKINFGKADFTIADIVKESKTNPDVKNFWDKLVASDKINAALVKHDSKGTFTLTIGLPKTTEIISEQVIEGGPDKITTTTTKLANGAVQTAVERTVYGDTTITDTSKTLTSSNKADVSFESSLTAIVGAQSWAEFIDGCKVANLSNESAGLYKEETSTKAGADIDIKSDSQSRVVEKEPDSTTTTTTTTEPPKPEITEEINNSVPTPPGGQLPQPVDGPESTEGTDPSQPTPGGEAPGEPADGPESTENVDPNQPTPGGEAPGEPDTGVEGTNEAEVNPTAPSSEAPGGSTTNPESSNEGAPTPGTPSNQAPGTPEAPLPSDNPADPVAPLPPDQTPTTPPVGPSLETPTNPTAPTPTGQPPVGPQTPNPNLPADPDVPVPPTTPPVTPITNTPPGTAEGVLTPPTPAVTPPTTPVTPEPPTTPVPNAPVSEVVVSQPTPGVSQPSDSFLETGGKIDTTPIPEPVNIPVTNTANTAPVVEVDPVFEPPISEPVNIPVAETVPLVEVDPVFEPPISEPTNIPVAETIQNIPDTPIENINPVFQPDSAPFTPSDVSAPNAEDFFEEFNPEVSDPSGLQ